MFGGRCRDAKFCVSTGRGRYSVPWQVLLRTVIVCPCGLSRFVSPCPCESEVPFGQLRPCFFVSAVVVGKACCFRYWRVAKRNDGWWWRCCLQGAVCLVVPFAKQPVRAERLGSDGDAGTLFRRPSGLRGNGCGSQMKRRGLLLFVNRLRARAR